MPHRSLRSLLGLLGLLLGCLVAAGCTPAPLAHPAILGASASAGFGCECTGSDGKPYLVDMEAVYQATVTGWRGNPVFLADAGFYARPREVQVEQMDAALAQNPSIIIAVDYLFWSVYGGRDTTMTADAVERDRHDALEQALAQLNRFPGPIIVGDIPNMRAATGRMLSERNIPSLDQLDAFNRRIYDWADHRPASGPAVIIPAANLGRSIESHAPLTTSFETFPPEQAAALIQADHLHPTSTGLAVLLREGLAGLAAKGVIKPEAFRTNLTEVAAQLPTEAAAADSRREPGLWTLLSVKGKLTDFGTAIEKKDCTKASELFDQVMEKTSRLKKSPHEMAGLYISFTLMGYRTSCTDAAVTIRRWRDRLDPAIERPLPDPWPLDMWTAFNSFLDDDSRTLERAVRLKRNNPNLPKDYSDTLYSAARTARFTDPAVYLELIPSWQAELEARAKTAKSIENYWRGFAKTPAWPAYAEQNYTNRLTFVTSDENRRAIEARKDYYTSPDFVIASSRAMTLEDIVTLERALRITGHNADADTVRDRLESIAPPDEIKDARSQVDKEAAATNKRAAKVQPSTTHQ